MEEYRRVGGRVDAMIRRWEEIVMLYQRKLKSVRYASEGARENDVERLERAKEELARLEQHKSNCRFEELCGRAGMSSMELF